MLKLNGFLSRALGTALRRMREGPLPEVREVDWSEWEHSVAAWDDSQSKAADAARAPGAKRLIGALPEVIESDWSVWEESVQAIERARRRRDGRE
jgi:hypothetical protein